MSLPLIGITTYRQDNAAGLPIQAVQEKYIDALASAGAAPLLIPNGISEPQLDALLARLDGILFTGGGDIHPRFFDFPLDEKVDLIDEDRDRVELYLLRHTLDRRLPLLGICRGFQLLNVGLGGSLYTDIPTQIPEALRHDWYPEVPRDYLAHPVSLVSGSRLAHILGESTLQVNSLHHQGARAVPQALTPVAFAPDGIVEAVELPDYPYALAVQWHPEWLQDHAPMRRLFASFVAAARSR